MVVEVFSTKMRDTDGGFDLKDTLLDSQERYIESSSTQVESENVSFGRNLLIETVRYSSGSRLIDDMKDVETINCTSILRGCCECSRSMSKWGELTVPGRILMKCEVEAGALRQTALKRKRSWVYCQGKSAQRHKTPNYPAFSQEGNKLDYETKRSR